MGPVLAILGSLERAMRRDLATFRSIQVNNFFIFVLLLIYGAMVSGVRPASSYPFLLLLGLLLIFPLSSDPLAKVPRSRMGIWPLSGSQKAALRLASLLWSPITWVALFLVFKVQPSLVLVFLGLAVVARGLVHVPAPGALAWVRAGALLRKDLRQMFSVLDTYVAVVIAAGGVGYRLFAAKPDPAAMPMFAMLVTLALSTYSQALFALDGPSGITRYALMPVGPGQILRSKDNAFLLLLFVLVAPLHLASGLAFGFTALAIGHYPAMRLRLPLERWRFARGRFLFGSAQMVLGAALGFGAARNVGYLMVSVGLYAASLFLAQRL